METVTENRDYVLVECELEKLKELVEGLEASYKLITAKQPSICLTMIRAEDSLEKQEFYLGEALTSDCEVLCEGKIGYGICLGEEPDRAFCIAAIEAIIATKAKVPSVIEEFIIEQEKKIRHAEKVEFNHILKTRVDFKLFEEA